MNRKNLVLVVDDNSDCRKLLAGVLGLHGFRTISATCGCEAVDLAILFQPRLVLMDLTMPGMDGYEATRAIHAHPRGRRIPVVAVTAERLDYRYLRRASEVGVVACLGKPWDEEALLQMVRRFRAPSGERHNRMARVNSSWNDQ
jgi:CheY-like chemotaxis protein